MPARKVVSAKVGGVVKRISLSYTEGRTPFGKYKLLDARNTDLPKVELIKIANEAGLPVLSDYGEIFPQGKTAMDFIKKR